MANSGLKDNAPRMVHPSLPTGASIILCMPTMSQAVRERSTEARSWATNLQYNMVVSHGIVVQHGGESRNWTFPGGG